MAVLCVLEALVGGPHADVARPALQPIVKQLEAVAQILARRAEMERKYLTKLEGTLQGMCAEALCFSEEHVCLLMLQGMDKIK